MTKLSELRDRRTDSIVESGLPEIPLSALARRKNWLEDTRDGLYFRVEPDANPASAQGLSFFVDESGCAFLLRRVGSRDDVEQARAEASARRSARQAPVEELRAQIRQAEIEATLAEKERLAGLRAMETTR